MAEFLTVLSTLLRFIIRETHPPQIGKCCMVSATQSRLVNSIVIHLAVCQLDQAVETSYHTGATKKVLTHEVLTKKSNLRKVIKVLLTLDLYEPNQTALVQSYALLALGLWQAVKPTLSPIFKFRTFLLGFLR